MSGVPWTMRERREAASCAERGMAPFAIARHLHRLGYPLRTRNGVSQCLSKLGIRTGTAGQPWASAEDGALRAAYTAGGSLRALGRALGRTPAAIRYRVEAIGLQGTHPQPKGWCGRDWTVDEEALLAELWPILPAMEVAARLGRTFQATANRAQSLGIKALRAGRPWSDDELRAIRIAHMHGISIVDLADAMGRDPSVVSRQARRRMGLRFSRRINRGLRTPRASREPITLAGVLALAGGAVGRMTPVWSVLAGVSHPRLERAA